MQNFSNEIYELSENLGKELRQKKLKISVAESCTGGLIGAALTEIPGSSSYFYGGILCYSNYVKMGLLQVPSKVLETDGAVSESCVIAMLYGLKKIFPVECGISVSGIAGPDGGTEIKPIGLVYIGIMSPKRIIAYKEIFMGDRNSVRNQAVLKSLQFLYSDVLTL